eukprot:9147464-Pyramimonas_sp.AAC.1
MAQAAPVATIKSVIDDVRVQALGGVGAVARQFSASFQAVCKATRVKLLPLSIKKTGALASSKEL